MKHNQVRGAAAARSILIWPAWVCGGSKSLIKKIKYVWANRSCATKEDLMIYEEDEQRKIVFMIVQNSRTSHDKNNDG